MRPLSPLCAQQLDGADLGLPGAVASGGSLTLARPQAYPIE